MNFVFFGTPDFAAIVLSRLIAAGFVPAVVVCNPDKPVGRKKIVTPPPTKLLAQEHRIPVLQPETLDNFELRTSNFELFVATAYAQIIPQDILRLPRLGTIGVHPSLLPRYRGPSPIQTAILEGATETGVTLYLLDEKVDHGPVVTNSKFQIPNSITYTELEQALAEMAGELLIKTLPKFAAGKITPQPQDETLATSTKKFSTEDGFVDPDELDDSLHGSSPEKAAAIERKIRALTPEPGAWTLARALGTRLPKTPPNKRVKLLEAAIEQNRLVLKNVQIEGERPRRL